MKCIKWAFPLLLLLAGCEYHDPELEYPDCCGKGYNLTDLGCLVFGPWGSEIDARNISIKAHDSVISSVRGDSSFLQESLVFELHKDRTIKYWFRYGYDTAWLKSKLSKPENQSVVFTNGKWTYQPKDSLLRIDFDNEFLNLPPLEGKYTHLGSNNLALAKITSFDSLLNKQKTKVTRVETLYFHHI